MKRHLLRLVEIIDALDVRQRLPIFLVILLLTVGLFYLTLLGPTLQQQAKLTQTIEQDSRALKDVQQQIAPLARSASQDPNTQYQLRRDALQIQIAQTQTDLDRLQAGRLTPARMAQLLETLLRDNRKLHLVSIHSFSEAPVTSAVGGPVAGPKPTEPAESAKATGLYKQGVRMIVRGNYVDLVRYLATLEQQPWKVIWGETTFRLDRHPIGTLTFTLYTLSPEKAWLRV